jgi:hypothetical protein
VLALTGGRHDQVGAADGDADGDERDQRCRLADVGDVASIGGVREDVHDVVDHRQVADFGRQVSHGDS